MLHIVKHFSFFVKLLQVVKPPSYNYRYLLEVFSKDS